METTIKLWIPVILFYVVIKILVITHGRNLKLIFESAYNTQNVIILAQYLDLQYTKL